MIDDAQGYVVALFTHGSENGIVPQFFLDLDEAREWIASPPEAWAPRPQDELLVFAITQVVDR